MGTSGEQQWDADSRPLPEVIVVHRLRWLGHRLRLCVHRPNFRALFIHVLGKAGGSDAAVIL